ncbi:MAG: hypothetical protein GY721_02960, partial [Deltaproteobacteria bacterium]|nr:hypothetical protein [Deltaproteobacteria bacterium]
MGEDPYFREQRIAGTLDHDIIEVKLEWMSGHGNRRVRERLRKPGNNAKGEWREYYGRKWKGDGARGVCEEQQGREEREDSGSEEHEGRKGHEGPGKRGKDGTREGRGAQEGDERRGESVEREDGETHDIFQEIYAGAEEVRGRTWIGKSVWGLRGRNKRWMNRHGALSHFANVKCEKNDSVLLLPGDIFMFEEGKKDFRGRYERKQWEAVRKELREEIKKIGFAGQNYW